MIICDHIPFTLDGTTILSDMKIKPGTRSAARLNGYLDEARRVARPKGMYREAFIEERQGSRVVIDGVALESPALQKNLDGVERVFPYVATCGTEINGLADGLTDLPLKTRAGIIRLFLLRQAEDYIGKQIRDSFGIETLSTMNPGSGDAVVWPFEQQHRLFSLMHGDEAKIGVTLADSGIMSPDMTVSGIFFPSETTYRNCQLCRRENCPSRKAPFDTELWKSVFG